MRCIQDLRARGLRVVFYPLPPDGRAGLPLARAHRLHRRRHLERGERGRRRFLGTAAPSQFTRDTTNLTVGYSGSPTDYTFRRMILHYANLCVVAGASISS